jgi:hypothetical protein
MMQPSNGQNDQGWDSSILGLQASPHVSNPVCQFSNALILQRAILRAAEVQEVRRQNTCTARNYFKVEAWVMILIPIVIVLLALVAAMIVPSVGH